MFHGGTDAVNGQSQRKQLDEPLAPDVHRRARLFDGFAFGSLPERGHGEEEHEIRGGDYQEHDIQGEVARPDDQGIDKINYVNDLCGDVADIIRFFQVGYRLLDRHFRIIEHRNGFSRKTANFKKCRLFCGVPTQNRTWAKRNFY